MKVLGVILARAGSRGLREKCMRDLLGRPLIDYTFDHALSSETLSDVVFTTDCEAAADLAASRGIDVVDRPAELATDTATVDSAARHAVRDVEDRLGEVFDAVVLLYGNIPVRGADIIDRAVRHLAETGADSVRSVAPVTKLHPDWLHRLEGDRMVAYRPNSIYRRQDLEPLYFHDGAVIAVTRESLFMAEDAPTDCHAFFGWDRRAVVQDAHETVDVDGLIDLRVAEAILAAGEQPVFSQHSS